MSEEVSEIIQIAELMFRIGKGVTLAVIKVWTSAYYGQWYGKASLQKLHKICGSHISYLEVSTENQKVLKDVKKKLFDKYKILYADLPDLRVDGCTQFAFHGDQAESIKAALNMYNSERLQLLDEAKQNYGEGTPKYHEAKRRIAEQYPEIRPVTAEDYALTRFQADGKTLTEEYKRLESSAKKELKKNNNAKPERSFTERSLQFADSDKRIKYEGLIKDGKAHRLEVAEFDTEYVPIAGKETPFYRAPVGEGQYVVLTQQSLLDDHNAVVLTDKTYPVISTSSEQIAKMSGKEISQKVAEESVKQAAKSVAKETAKTAAKTMAKTTPYTAAAEATLAVGKKVLEYSRGSSR